MNHKLQFVDRAQLVIVDNVRVFYKGIDELKQDIIQKGLINAIIGRKDKDETIEVGQGHRRLMAINAMTDEEYNRIFPKGVPVDIVSNLNDTEWADIKVDHGNMQGLADVFELYLCCKKLFDTDHSEQEVVVSLAGLFNAFFRPKPEKLREFETLRKKGLDTEANQEFFRYHRGSIQNLHNACRCPVLVEEAMYFKATGENRIEA